MEDCRLREAVLLPVSLPKPIMPKLTKSLPAAAGFGIGRWIAVIGEFVVLGLLEVVTLEALVANTFPLLPPLGGAALALPTTGVLFPVPFVSPFFFPSPGEELRSNILKNGSPMCDRVCFEASPGLFTTGEVEVVDSRNIDDKLLELLLVVIPRLAD